MCVWVCVCDVGAVFLSDRRNVCEREKVVTGGWKLSKELERSFVVVDFISSEFTLSCPVVVTMSS